MKYEFRPCCFFSNFVQASIIIVLLLSWAAFGQRPPADLVGTSVKRNAIKLNAAGTAQRIDWSRQIDGYKDLADSDPANAVIQNNLGVAYAMQSQYDPSILALTKATRLDPQFSRAFLNLAIVLGRVSRTTESYAAIKTAVELSPTDIPARSILCETALAMRLDTESLACYEQLVQIADPDAYTMAKYGMALILNKKYPPAIKILETSIEKLPQMAAAQNALGVAYFNMKRYDEAIAVLKRATETDPENDQARFNLGVAQLVSRNRAAVLSQYRILKESNPKLAEQLYNMLYRGMVVDARGR